MPLTDIQQQRLLSLGAKVRSLREGKGMSLSDLAHKIDKDKQSVHRLEQGRINPSFLYLLEICEGLDISLSELLKDL